MFLGSCSNKYTYVLFYVNLVEKCSEPLFAYEKMFLDSFFSDVFNVVMLICEVVSSGLTCCYLWQLRKPTIIAEKFILLLIFYTDALGIWSDHNPFIFLHFTIDKAGIILSITIPALYDKFEDHVDRFAGMIHRKFSKHYKIVDESLQSRLPRTLAKEKDP